MLTQPAHVLSEMLTNREISAVDLMQATLARIAYANPAVNAIVSLREPDALLAEAAEADATRRKGWMHGFPHAVKDLTATKGLRTTWGSPLFANFIPETDDLIVRRMKAAGAIIIGKTNTPEFGLGSHSFNPVHGVTRNPYDLARSAGGSSGGAAAALACRMVPVADGSDMMGSLRNPAAFCNVYGFRPTWDLIPADPEGDTYLHVMATNGPMARCPRDLAHLLEVLAGPDPRLPHGRMPARYSAGLDADMCGKRIGWLADWGGAYAMEPGILAQCETALQVFSDLGCSIEPLAPPFPAEQLWQSWCILRAWANATGKKDLYADPRKRALLKPEILWEVEQGQHLTAQQIHDASVIRSRYYADLAGLFDRFDALALPSAQVWPFPADWRYPQTINGTAMETYHRWMEVVIPVSLAGVPALSVPAGFGENGLPMGLQIFGRAGADHAILQLGQAYHQATDWPNRRPPPI